MKRYFAFGVVLAFGLVLLVIGSPVRAQGPVENAQQTLWAATREMQQTRDAREFEIAAQRATVARLTVVAAEERATASAVSARETSLAQTATAQAQQTARAIVNANATATAQAHAIAAAWARQTETAAAIATTTARAQATATAQTRETQSAQTTATSIAVALTVEEQRTRNQAREHAARLGLTAIAMVALVVGMVALVLEQVRRWRMPPRVVEVVAPPQPQHAQVETRVMVIDDELAMNFERILEHECVAADKSAP